ncbi:hypothetical protein GGTG_14345 [Gaeumannomyces tritici R3-111a-1]|uniref:Uncharacterized protein n=1 Tax=Gaeumannomyces tritici (strain R3-111a-1) TaxID=644352 RepID=J3PL93_GAET3|nr:hypothetical protein GGTG_14345 [Gaeumannomyces tritici R3-111a-1]EJT68076.1 hypothetical protein GGTG_14345 [Gaeumannomyces tritici R3-111a-1]
MADEFWASLTGQLGLFMKDRGRFLEQYGRNLDWCLPQLLKAVKEIIQTMIAAQDCELLSEGMRSLLGVLEAMKLDVANHIIRSLRERIIDDTVNFLQRHFRRKLQVDFDIADAKTWYWNASRQYSAISTTPETRQGLGDMAVFFYGLSAMVLPTSLPKHMHGVPEDTWFRGLPTVQLGLHLYASLVEFGARGGWGVHQIGGVRIPRCPASDYPTGGISARKVANTCAKGSGGN